MNKPNNQYPTPSIWEAMAIAAIAVGLVIAALTGLSIKAVNNTVDPKRAEAIALSIMNYNIPEGSRGLFGVNVGGLKIAEVVSKSNIVQQNQSLPEISLLVAEIVPEETENPNLTEENVVPWSEYVEDDFQANQQTTVNKLFCGSNVPVTIEQGVRTSLDYSLPAVRYNASTVIEDRQYFVKITTTGKDALSKADLVFNSLICQ